MSVFQQAEWPADVAPFVYTEGIVNAEYPVGQFVARRDASQSSLQIIQVGEFEGKLLVAVPLAAWHRQLAQRVLPYNALSKPTLVEVQAALPGDLTAPIDDLYLKVWVGYLKDSYRGDLEVLEEFNVDFWFDGDSDRRALPYAHGLVEMAQEHFAFFSADGASTVMVPEGEVLDVPPESGGGSGLDGEPMTEADVRLSRMEDALQRMGVQIQSLMGPKLGAPKKKAQAKPPAKAKPKAAQNVGSSAARRETAEAFPLLDAGVVAAALQAGVPQTSLMEMQKLMGANSSKASKVSDMNPKIKPRPDPLSEGEDVENFDEMPRQDYGYADPPDRGSTMDKLTSIIEILTEDRVKKASQSKLDIALDGGSSGSTDHPLQGTGKKAAAARRALRASYQDCPEEISGLIERLIYEDLNNMTMPPGMTSRSVNARSWVEFRSRITSHKTSAYASWGVAGILDSLIAGDYKKARARSAVLLMCLVQAAVDSGSWALAGEISLEPAPPFMSLSAHRPPAVADGESPYSRLLDARWAEVSLAHLKETDEYLLKRRNVGRNYKAAATGSTDDAAEADPKKRPRPKAKPKAQPAAPAAEV